MDAQEVEITSIIPLLQPTTGELTCAGFARTPCFRYDRSHVAAHWSRIKEWDYYSVLCPERGFGITITLADLGLIGLAVVVLLELDTGTFQQVDAISLLPRGGLGLGKQSHCRTGVKDDVLIFQSRKLSLVFNYETMERRTLSFTSPGFKNSAGDVGLIGRIELAEIPKGESMTIATTWPDAKTCFYHNTKINCLTCVGGGFTIGKKEYVMASTNKNMPVFGVLDWGRGVWPWKAKWYWSSLSCMVGTHQLGWNFGYGFSDREPASENMLILDGHAHKIKTVEFHVNEQDWMLPWKFTSGDGIVDVTMTPHIDRSFHLDLKLIKSIQHQVYGTFSGVVTIAGQKLVLDNVWGFAEVVDSRW